MEKLFAIGICFLVKKLPQIHKKVKNTEGVSLIK